MPCCVNYVVYFYTVPYKTIATLIIITHGVFEYWHVEPNHTNRRSWKSKRALAWRENQKSILIALPQFFFSIKLLNNPIARNCSCFLMLHFSYFHLLKWKNQHPNGSLNNGWHYMIEYNIMECKWFQKFVKLLINTIGGGFIKKPIA